MADDIGGLEVRFTAEASQLRSELQRMEQQLRQFERAHGRQRVQLTAGFERPGQRALDDFRRDAQKRVGQISVPIRLEVPAQQALDRQIAGIGKRIGTVPVTVKGVWGGWQTPPPGEITISVKGIGGGTGGAGGAAAALPAAPSAGRVQAPAAAIAGARTAADREAEREAIRRAREETRRRDRDAAAGTLASSRPAGREKRPPPAQSRETAYIQKMAGNEAKAQAQQQPVSKRGVFADWSNKDILETLGEQNPESFARDLRNEAMRRGILKPQAAGGPAGFSGSYVPGGAGRYPHFTQTGTKAMHAATVRTLGQRGELNRPVQGLYDAYPLTGSVKRPTATAAGLEAMGGVPALVKNLTEAMGMAMADPRAVALKPWYQKAGPISEGISSNLGSAYSRENRVMSAGVFSTQASWEENLRNAQDFFDAIHAGASSFDEVTRAVRGMPHRGGKNATMLSTTRSAWETLNASDPEAYLRGPKGQSNPKLANFGLNLLGDLTRNTADRHETMMATGQRFSRPADRRASDMIQEASGIVAGRLGIKTAEGQAIRWGGALGTEIAGPDPHGFERRQSGVYAPQGAAQRIATPPAAGPQIAAWSGSFGRSGTAFAMMGEAGSHIDPVMGTPTMAAQVSYGQMRERELTTSEYAARQRKIAQNREDARWASISSTPMGTGIAAFADEAGPASSPSRRRPYMAGTNRFASNAAYESAQARGIAAPPVADPSNLEVPAYMRRGAAARRAPGMGTVSLAETMSGDPGDVSADARAAMASAGGPEGPSDEDVDADALLRRYGIGAARSPEEATIRDISEQGRLMVAQARGAGQVRAVGTTLASSIATVAGGRAETQIAQRRIEQLITLANKVGTEYGDAFANARKAQVEFDEATARGESPERLAELSANLEKMNAAAAPGRRQLAAVGEELAGLEGKMGRFRQAAIGFGSSIAGTLAGLTIFGGVQAGMDAIVNLGGKSIDVISGFTNEAGKVTRELGLATRQMHGFAEEAVSAAFVSAGLGKATAGNIRPLLEERAALEAGNTALGDQITLIKAATNFRMQNRLAEQGLPVGPMMSRGAIPGISAASGGLLNSPLFAQTPLIEQVAEVGPRGTAGQRAGIRGVTGGIGALAGGAIGGLVGLLGGPFGVAAGIAGGAAIGGGLGATVGGNFAEELAGMKDLNLQQPGRYQALQAAQSGGEQPGITNGVITGPISYQGGMIDADTANKLAAAGVNVRGDEQANDPGTSIALARAEAMVATVQDLGEAAARANPELARTVEIHDLMGKTGAEAERLLDRSSASLRALGVAEDQIESYRAARVAITGRGGEQLSREQGQDWWRAAGQGAAMPDREEAVRNMMKPLSAALQMIDWQGMMQRETMIPGQEYLQGLASGSLQVGGARRGFGIRQMPSEVAEQAPNYDKITGELNELQQTQQSVAQTGRTQLLTMLREADSIMGAAAGSAGSLTSQFEALESSIANNGGAMRGLQLENMWEQVNLQVAQYDEQIRVAGRSLADAQSFVSGAGNGTLGLLQHQARQYERQSTAIGFQQQALSIQSQQLGLQNAHLGIRSRELGFQTTQLQMQSREIGMQGTELALQQRQRQINFQRAMAGFTAPGMTGAERAARQDEANAEAAYAQRQQDIAVSQFEIEQQIFDLEKQQLPIAQAQLAIDQQQVALQAQNIGLAQQALAVSQAAYNVQQQMIDVQAARAIEDLSIQLDLLTRARTVTLMVAVNNEAIAAYQERIEADMARMSSVIQEAYGIQQKVTENAAALAAQYGGRLTQWNNTIISGLNDYLVKAGLALSGMWSNSYSGYGGPTPSTGGGGGGGAIPRAAGFFQNVSGPTTMTVGEAGPETVAILRNPRNVTMGPSGGGDGGITLHFDIHGNTIGGGAENLDEFAAVIARRVEEAIGRRVGQYGLGTRR